MLVQTSKTKEGLTLLRHLMVNKIKILINVSILKKKQPITLNKMKIKKDVDMHHKKKKEKMKTKIIRNRFKLISIKRINKTTYLKTQFIKILSISKKLKNSNPNKKNITMEIGEEVQVKRLLLLKQSFQLSQRSYYHNLMRQVFRKN